MKNDINNDYDDDDELKLLWPDYDVDDSNMVKINEQFKLLKKRLSNFFVTFFIINTGRVLAFYTIIEIKLYFTFQLLI